MTLILPDTSRAVARDLRRLFGADLVKDDVPTKTAYAVDASIYRVSPKRWCSLSQSTTSLPR